jgi:5-(carboxyamino)imidazole ribonucleotide synthase
MRNIDIIKKRIGIVGGGQLGKMMILEAKRLGFYVAVLDPCADCPASSICDELIVADFKGSDGYFELAKKVDVITYEFEHINSKALEEIEKSDIPVYPSVKSLKNIQNKFLQKSILSEHGIPVPRLSKDYTPVLGKKQMFKSELDGYDGKGNYVIENESDIPENVDGFFEELIDFEMEVSVLACRGIDGTQVVYPVAENEHINSILDTTIVPARISVPAMEKAKAIADRVMEIFEGVGTFCVEMFVTKSGDVLVNEVAPRPHNSGHYTIEGCFANQFENHVRAIVGLPFGCTELIQPTVMVNVLGAQKDGKAVWHGIEEAYKKEQRLHIHIYGKSESKINRKMGHFTLLGSGNDLDGTIKAAEGVKGIVKVIGE